MKNFRDLKVWTKAHKLALAIYGATRQFPRAEIYGLTSQIRRAAVSVPANIAEGCGRGSDPEFGRFVQIALGSASELEYHLLLSHDLDLLEDRVYVEFEKQIVEIKRMLAGLLTKLKADR